RRQTEVPVFDLDTLAPPFVGPGEREHPGAAAGEGSANLPAQRMRLLLLAVSAAVQSHLGEHQRPVPCKVLQAGEVGLEPLSLLEVDVEAEEIEKRELEVLGRRKIDVRDEA